MINFTDLRAQIEDGLILEDELELAKLAAEVPSLVNSLCGIIEACRNAEVLLAGTIKVLSEIQGNFDKDNISDRDILTEMFPTGEQIEIQQKSQVTED